MNELEVLNSIYDILLSWQPLINLITGCIQSTFNGVLNTIKELIPIVVPAVVGFLAFRKGWSFLKGEIRKA